MTARLRRGRGADAAIVLALLALGGWLRVVHLGRPSLWWDELVELRTADRPLGEVLHEVKWGIPPGAGNAGAMPADYVLLHAFLAATPAPPPERIEAHARTPACVYAVLAVLAEYVAARAVFGRATATVAGLLLATSLPAILYAAEVRAYALVTLMTLLQLLAFAALVRAPSRARAWLVYSAANVAYFLTGLFGLFVMAAQYAVVVGLALRRRARARTLAFVVASGTAIALAVVGYFAGVDVTAPHPRSAVVEPLATSVAAVRFLAADSPWLVGAFVLGLPLALVAARRRGTLPVAVAIVASFAALPAIALLIRWKHYYFHGRHVLFLLPLFHLVVAAGATEAIRRLAPARRTLGTAVACALAVGVVAPGLRTFLVAPEIAFAQTKTLRDTKVVVQRIAARVVTLAPQDRYLLLAERDSVANAVLVAYLDWYRLADRVVVRSPGVPLPLVEPMLAARGGDPEALALRPAVGLTPDFRRLLRIDPLAGDVPARPAATGIVAWTTPLDGPGTERLLNVTLRERGAPPPSPPRS